MTKSWIFIVVLTIGLLLSITGLLYKRRYWPYAEELVIIAPVVYGIAIRCIIVNFILLKSQLNK